MTPEQWQRIEALLDAALALPVHERRLYIAQAAGDGFIEGETLALLSEHEKQSGFLDEKPFVPLQELSPGHWIGPYRIQKEIGEGGMGKVYLAVRADDQFRKQVAIKVLKNSFSNQELVKRFRNERQILATLDHPNIAHLLDGGTTPDGDPYFVMDYVEGTPIDVYCRDKRLDTNEILELFRTVCSAVEYAHSRLIVHRDLKPNNILVTDAGMVKLLDFGIAKLLDDSDIGIEQLHTMDARPMTPDYASPEQVSGTPVTTVSDVYSLGVILYQLLTGQKPYEIHEHVLAKIREVVCNYEPERPSTAVTKMVTLTGETAPINGSRSTSGQLKKLQRRLSGDLDTIVMMALRKEPQRRYRSVEQFSEDIRRHLEGRTVIAQADTFGYRSSKFIRRNKWPLTAAAMLFVSLTAGIVGTTYQWRRADRRFNEVRTLATSFLFNFHNEIWQLKGAEKARGMLLDQARTSLDGLAKEASRDPSLQRELAEAYRKLALMEGNPFYINQGFGDKALRDFQRSLELHESATGQPDKNGLGMFAKTYWGIGDMLLREKPDKAIEHYRKSLKVYERLIALDAADSHSHLAEAFAYAKIAGALRRMGHTSDAITAYEKSVSIAEPFLVNEPEEGSRVLIPTYGSLGVVLQNTGKTAAALAYYKKSAGLNEKLATQMKNNAAVNGNLAFTFGRIATLDQQMGNITEALSYSSRSVQMMEQLLDPKDQRSQENLAGAYRIHSGVLRKSGHLSDALESAGKALAADETLARKSASPHSLLSTAEDNCTLALYLERTQDKNKALEHTRTALEIDERIALNHQGNVEFQEGLSSAHYTAGKVLQALGKLPDAQEHFRKAIDISRGLVRLDANDRGLQAGLALQLAALGASEKNGDFKQAVGHLSEAVRLYEVLVALDPINVEWQMSLARSRAWLGDALAKGGESNAAIAQFEKAVSIKTLLKTGAGDVELLQTLGEIYYGQGGMFEALAERKTIPANERQQYRKGAQSSYENGADILIDPNGRGLLDYNMKRILNGILAGRKRLEQLPTT